MKNPNGVFVGTILTFFGEPMSEKKKGELPPKHIVHPILTEEKARAVLREYPDADLSSFHVEGNVEAMAVEEADKSIAELTHRAEEKPSELS